MAAAKMWLDGSPQYTLTREQASRAAQNSGFHPILSSCHLVFVSSEFLDLSWVADLQSCVKRQNKPEKQRQDAVSVRRSGEGRHCGPTGD